MKIFSKGIIVGIGLVAVFFTSCKKQLEIAPRQSIDAATALTTRDAIDASILSVYVRLKSAREYGRDLIALPEALADNGFATNKSGRFVPEAQNNSGAHFTTVPWTSNYAGVNQINLTLEALPTLNLTPAVTQVERDRWEGQLYFLRGLMLFDIARVYAYTPGATVAAQDRGGVPILTKGVSSADSALTFFPSRPSIDDDYTQIVNDLQLANTKLSTSNLGVNLANKACVAGFISKIDPKI